MSYSNTPGAHYFPTLVIDENGAAASQLAGQLTHSGFAADTVTSCTAAIAAVRARHYASMVFIGDVGHPIDLRCIAQLRRRVPRSWIIMISSTGLSDTRELFLRYGVDALLVAPFSTADLASRLSAFSHRSRPP